MKHFYFLLLAVSGFSLSAQIVSIPDNNFKAKLISLGVDANNDNLIQETEALTVTTLNLNNLNIFSLAGIQSFDNLITLNCNDNQLTTLNVSGMTHLQTLNCKSNLITTLNLAGASALKNIDCSMNVLTALNLVNMPQLENVICQVNNINSINLTGSTALKRLTADRNKLTNLNFLNGFSNLEYLIVHENRFTTLDLSGLGLTNLKLFDCHYSLLMTSLTVDGLSNLELLSCSESPILTTINLSGLDSLTELSFASSHMSSMDYSGVPNLTKLNCQDNFFTTVDVSSLHQLQYLICGGTSVQRVFAKNGSNEEMNLYNAPNLEYICADDSQLTQLSIVLNNLEYDDCVLNSYCSFNPGGDFYTITGNNRFDSFNDGCDASDINYPSLKLQLSDGNVSGNFFPDPSGHYEIGVIEGSHTITPILENPAYFNVSPTTATITFPTDASPFDQSFCITADGAFPDLEVVIAPINAAIPGFDAQYKIVLRNKGNQVQSGAVSMNFNDTVLDFNYANPAADSQSTGTLSWNFTDLLPFETRQIAVNFNLNSPVEVPPLQSGDLLYYTASLTTSETDAMPEDNTFTFVHPVVNSFDPNDITCLEGSTVPPSMAGKYVHYLIRFENTGTAPAHNIVVKTTVSNAKFVISSLTPIMGSHPFTMRVDAANKVEFIFQDIQLPFDDANNDGYILFKVKIRPTLTVGATFGNTANIYFDYNAPIVTNTATTTIQVLGTDDFDFNDHFTLFPNPANDILNIKSKDNVATHSFSVYNTLGQLVMTTTDAQGTIDVSRLASGSYIIKIIFDIGTASARFFKN